MTRNKVLTGKTHAENPHGSFAGKEVLPTAMPGRTFLHFRKSSVAILALAFSAATMARSVASAAEATDVSEPVHVMVSPEASYLWHTATGTAMRIEWDLPPSAGYADFHVLGSAYSNSVHLISDPHGYVDVVLPEPGDKVKEDVYRFVLSFSDGSCKTASVGLVCGHTCTDGGKTTPVRCRTDETAPSWNSAGRLYVIPVPQGTRSLAVNGEEVETCLNGDAGWYAAGRFEKDAWTRLALTADSIHVAEVLSRGVGHVILFR